METLYIPNKLALKVIEIHEDSESNKSKSSSILSFWGSPELSPGIENLFDSMNLCDDSNSLIIFINLCNVKNMIHLSNLELDELSSLVSRKEYGIQNVIPDHQGFMFIMDYMKMMLLQDI
jgi:hypothetical protein